MYTIERQWQSRHEGNDHGEQLQQGLGWLRCSRQTETLPVWFRATGSLLSV
jgi:hypothetical protein